jgi:hypothetical protein
VAPGATQVVYRAPRLPFGPGRIEVR